MRTQHRRQSAIAAIIETGLPQGEAFNSLSHLVGSSVCFCIAVALFVKVSFSAVPVQTFGVATYALTASVGFFCSALFHAAPAAQRRHLRRYDRATIYLAIGGFHFANISALMPSHAWLASLPMWTTIVHLMRQELSARRQKRDVLLYLVAGWGGCLLWLPLVSSLPTSTVRLETCGALVITLGALAFQLDRLPKNHQIWHLLIFSGSLCQIVALAGNPLS